MKGKPLDGVKVLEVAMWMFAPASGAILADFGADVVKIEHPVGGDPMRQNRNRLKIEDAPNVFTEIANRGKRSVGLDLGNPDALEIVYRLAETSDVFVTSFLPAARKKLRIDVEDIRARNPSIIYARATGFGQRGLESEAGGYDLAAGWGRGGTAYKLTPPGGEPPGMPASFYDLSGSIALAGGIAMALYQREKTGEAAVVDSSLLNAGMWPLGPDVLMAPFVGDFKVFAADRGSPANPTVNWYRTSDDRWVYLVHLQSDRYWPELCGLIGRQELVDDPRFCNHASRAEYSAECTAILDEIFAERTLEEWRSVLAGAEGVWAPIQSPGELHHDQQVIANGFLVPTTDQEGHDFKVVAPPVQFDDTLPSVRGPAPEAGQHTEDVLLELGLSWEEIIAGKESGAFQ